MEEPPLFSGYFNLPISYLEKQVHPLSPTIAEDLELDVSRNIDQETTEQKESTKEKENKSMYAHLMHPTHEFGRQMTHSWKSTFTSDTSFLQQTQDILLDLSKDEHVPNLHINGIKEIWARKCDADFINKYQYLEWDVLASLNRSSSFLQTLATLKYASPLISLLLPLFLLCIPFFLLKIKRIPITIHTYIDILSVIAKNHFIGKICNVRPDAQSIIYVLCYLGFYGLSMYQNMAECWRMTANLQQMHTDMHQMLSYVHTNTQHMDAFLLRFSSKSAYAPFLKDIQIHRERLMCWYTKNAWLLDTKAIFGITHTPFMGKLMQMYYMFYKDNDLDASFRFSFGFEGYLDNILGIHRQLLSGTLQCAIFIDPPEQPKQNKNKIVRNKKTKPCIIKNQSYPIQLHENVKNTVSLSKNIILSGVNASGKTTTLKTTMLNIIFSQQFGVGFYDACSIIPYTHIHSYLNIPDTSGRDSLFQAESRRCKEILDIIKDETDIEKENKQEKENKRHFCIFDELYSGTNHNDAVKSSISLLKYLDRHENVTFLLTTHNVDVCKYFSDVSEKDGIEKDSIEKDGIEKDGIEKDVKIPDFHASHNIKNYHMEKYHLSEGISEIEGGIHILREMDYPTEILQNMMDLSC